MLARTIPSLDFTSDTQLFTGVVTESLDQHWLIDGELHCARATGCLLEPCVDDTVLCCETEDGSRYVLSVLFRRQATECRLSVDRAETVCLAARRLNISSTEEMNLSSLQHMRFNAALGTLHVHAQNLFSTVADTLVQTAQNYIGKMAQYSVSASGLLRQHGRHHVVTADQDVRIDGERITMG